MLPPGTFVALGDSYSSGEGNPPFFSGTDGPSDYCHRSPLAYAEVLGARYGGLPLFYACSGATTQNIENIPKDTEPPQFLEPGVDSSARLLTMTIGGNDAGFSSVLKACIEQKVKADAYNALIGPIASHFFGKDPSCAHSDTFTSSVDANIDNIFWLVKLTERGLLSKTDAVNTSIIVADYPYLFPATSDERSCLSLSLILTDDDMTWMNGEGDRLDGVLQEAAAEAGVNFVDVRGAFAGHAVCGSGGSWLNALSIASGSGSCTFSVLGQCVIPGGPPIIGSFHPNASGHADGYAASIGSFIDSATSRTANGLPANPPPAPDPPSTPAPSAAFFDELDVAAGHAEQPRLRGHLPGGAAAARLRRRLRTRGDGEPLPERGQPRPVGRAAAGDADRRRRGPRRRRRPHPAARHRPRPRRGRRGPDLPRRARDGRDGRRPGRHRNGRPRPARLDVRDGRRRSRSTGSGRRWRIRRR